MRLYQTSPRTYFHNEAHNHYLQIAAEGGLLLSIPAAGALFALHRDGVDTAPPPRRPDALDACGRCGRPAWRRRPVHLGDGPHASSKRHARRSARCPASSTRSDGRNASTRNGCRRRPRRFPFLRSGRSPTSELGLRGASDDEAELSKADVERLWKAVAADRELVAGRAGVRARADRPALRVIAQAGGGKSSS